MEKDDKGSTLIRIGVSGESSFWYRPTRVVPDQRPLNGRCCWSLLVGDLGPGPPSRLFLYTNRPIGHQRRRTKRLIVARRARGAGWIDWCLVAQPVGSPATGTCLRGETHTVWRPVATARPLARQTSPATRLSCQLPTLPFDRPLRQHRGTTALLH